MHYDHMCAKCEGNRRGGENFISADCSMFDVDNADSDDSKKWITPKDVKSAFPDVMFFVSYSRNHMKEKDGKAPRPKFHVYFPDATYDDANKYSKHKREVCQYFTAFDPKAKDATRVFFGVEQPKVEYFSGTRRLSEFMETGPIPTKSENKRADKHMVNRTGIILEGERNTTLFKIAMNIRRTIGDDENAFKNFLQESERCSPPLERKEVDGQAIGRSPSTATGGTA